MGSAASSCSSAIHKTSSSPTSSLVSTGDVSISHAFLPEKQFCYTVLAYRLTNVTFYDERTYKLLIAAEIDRLIQNGNGSRSKKHRKKKLHAASIGQTLTREKLRHLFYRHAQLFTDHVVPDPLPAIFMDDLHRTLKSLGLKCSGMELEFHASQMPCWVGSLGHLRVLGSTRAEPVSQLLLQYNCNLTKSPSSGVASLKSSLSSQNSLTSSDDSRLLKHRTTGVPLSVLAADAVSQQNVYVTEPYQANNQPRAKTPYSSSSSEDLNAMDEGSERNNSQLDISSHESSTSGIVFSIATPHYSSTEIFEDNIRISTIRAQTTNRFSQTATVVLPFTLAMDTWEQFTYGSRLMEDETGNPTIRVPIEVLEKQKPNLVMNVT